MSLRAEVAEPVDEAGATSRLMPTLVVVVGVQAMVSSLGAPLVPTIANDFGVTLGAAQWALTGALLMGAVATPLLGRMADLGCERSVLLAGLALVVAGSLVAALSQSLAPLLVGRVLQGIGLGLAPVAMALARVHVPQVRLGLAVGALSVAGVAGAGFSYPITSFITARWGLSAAFWFAFALAGATLIAGISIIPRNRGRTQGRVDWIGAVLLGAATLGALLVATQGTAWGWSSRWLLALAVGAFIATVSWVRYTLRTSEPLVDLRLARRPSTAGAHLTAVIVGAGVFYLLSTVMFLLQAPGPGVGLDQSVSTAGLILVPYALASVMGSRTAVTFTRWIPRERWLPLGAVLYLVATGLLAVWHDRPWQILAVMLVAGLGSGCTFTALPGMIINAVPAAETGSSLAFNTVLRYLGFTIGSACAGVVVEATSVTGTSISAQGLDVALAVVAVLWLVAFVTTLLVIRRPAGRTNPRSRRGVHHGQSSDQSRRGRR